MQLCLAGTSNGAIVMASGSRAIGSLGATVAQGAGGGGNLEVLHVDQ